MDEFHGWPTTLTMTCFDQLCRHLKTSLFVSEDTDQGRECLWFKWCYI